MSDTQIANVSDTALWVAVYRAQESERADALFRDPLAARLAGERGFAIARKMTGSRYTSWSLVIRTAIIDKLILQAIQNGVDTIVNLGAGLDSRPYRLALPPHLSWIEVDFPNMIQHKENILRAEKPVCRLQRISLDLANHEARKKLLARVAAGATKALVLTEGVVLYLDNAEAAELADDLSAHLQFAYWITDYLSPRAMRQVQRRRRKELKNAPMKFTPDDWFGFFAQHGWKPREILYLAEESYKLGRPVPLPWWATVLRRIVPGKASDEFKHFSAYILLEPNA